MTGKVTAPSGSETPGQDRVSEPGTKPNASRSWPDFAYPILLLILPFIFFLPATRGELMLGDGDAFVEFLPSWIYVAEQWSRLNPPFWTPYIFCGYPLIGDPQAGVFHPNNLLFLFLPPLAAMNVLVMIYYGLAGLFTYLLARAESLTREASLLAGIAFTFSGFLIGHQGISTVFITAACFPAFFYAIRLCFSMTSYLAVFWGMLTVLLLVLNGHPQFTFYSLFFGGSYAIYLLLFGQATAYRRLAFLKQIIAVYLLGSGLAAFQLLPTAELMLRSPRSGLTYEQFAGPSMPLGSLITGLWSTKIHHQFTNDASESVVDVGLWVLILALVGILLWRKGAGFWVFLLGFSSLLYLGDNTPLYQLMYWVPGYNLFRLSSRNGLVVVLAVALLAAYGLSSLQKRKLQHRLWIRGGTLIAIPLIYFFGIYRPEQEILAAVYRAKISAGQTLEWTMGTMREVVLPLLPILALMLLASAALILLLVRYAKGFAIGALTVVLVITHFWEYRSWIFAAPAKEVAQALYNPPAAASLPGSRSPAPSRLAWGGPSNWISLLQKDRSTWRSNYVNWGGTDVNMVHGLHSISGYSPLLLDQYSRIAGNMHLSGTVSEAGFFSSSALDLLNAEFVVVPPGELGYPAEAFARLELWGDLHGATVYRNPRATGLVRPVSRIVRMSEDQFWEKVKGDELDFLRTAYVTEPETSVEAASPLVIPDTVEGRYAGSNRIEVRVETAAQAFLAFSHPYYPGWLATIDGQRTDLVRINGMFTGVSVPAGSHSVVLRFIPFTFWAGLLIACLSVGTLVILAAKDRLHLSQAAVSPSIQS